jgi:hypothetical protein
LFKDFFVRKNRLEKRKRHSPIRIAPHPDAFPLWDQKNWQDSRNELFVFEIPAFPIVLGAAPRGKEPRAPSLFRA